MCDVCNGKITQDLNFKPAIRDGLVCVRCARLCDTYQFKTVAAMKSYYKENERRAVIFRKTKSLRGYRCEKVVIDELNQLFYIGKGKPILYFEFNEIQDFGYEEVGSQVSSKRRLDWSNIALGFMLLGPLGAFLGRSQRKDMESTIITFVALKIVLSAFASKKTVYMYKLPKGFEEFLNACTLRHGKLDRRLFHCRHCGQSDAITSKGMKVCRCHEMKY